MAKPRKPLDNEAILAILAGELSTAETVYGDEPKMVEALDYYLGNPNGQEIEGRSRLVSTDVADAIEWIMPEIMEAFTQNNEVVIFDPVHSGDERQAELESEYVYNILMKQNHGFILIHQFVKDALLHKNGILKVYYEEYDKVRTEEYTGVTELGLRSLLSSPNIDIVELTEYKQQSSQEEMMFNGGIPEYSVYDVKISIKTKKGAICIDPVPLEDFIVNRQHNSINLDKARFSAHLLSKSVSELVEEGYDLDVLDDLPASNGIRSQFRFNLQGESTFFDDGEFKGDPSSKIVDLAECFLNLDINGDGISEPVKVLVAGTANPSDVLDIQECDDNPWVATTAILMSHKFKGLSIFDRLKQIQDNKTSLIRNIMDNIYFQNNQRLKVLKGQVEMDDLLTSRPGGLVRMSTLGAVEPLVTPPVGDVGFTMMNYLDTVRAGRVGVSAEGANAPQNIGDRVGSEGVAQLMTSKEALVGLIVRVICETGIKPLMLKIRDLAVKHIDCIEDFKFKGEWVQVHPSSWIERNQSTVRVGTGTGARQAKIVAVTQVIAAQKEIMMMPGQALCDPSKAYMALDDFCKFSGLNGADRYFIDPTSQQGQQATQAAQEQSKAQQDKMDQATVTQLKAEADIAQSALMTAQAQQENVKLKAQVEQAKHQRELDKQAASLQEDKLKYELDQVKQILSDKNADEDRLIKEKELNDKIVITKMNNDTTIEVASMSKQESVDSDVESTLSPLHDKIEELKAEVIQDSLRKVLTEQYGSILKELKRPKTVLRGSDGKISGVK